MRRTQDVMDTTEQAKTSTPARKPVRLWIRTATISLNLLAAATALLASTSGIALTFGTPDIALRNDETEMFGLLATIALGGSIGLFLALPVLLTMNTLSWILSARARRAPLPVPEPIVGH